MPVRFHVDINHDKVLSRTDTAVNKTKLALKSQIIKDTNPLVPMRSAFLRNSAFRTVRKKDNYVKWGGAGVPYAHFQHEGKVMIGHSTHRPWAKKGETKVYTDRQLTYTAGGSKWVDKALERYKSNWTYFARKYFRKVF